MSGIIIGRLMIILLVLTPIRSPTPPSYPLRALWLTDP
jgi:hypothetical protein